MRKYTCQLLVISAITLFIVIQSQLGLTEPIEDVARQITVLVDSSNSGSGVIVGKIEDSYYVLTNNHVVRSSLKNRFDIITFDQLRHEAQNLRSLEGEGVDLAVLEFESKRQYRIADFGNSDNLRQGANVIVAGFPRAGALVRDRLLQITKGSITVSLVASLTHGYGLGYNNVARDGMSGGPVLDLNGRLVGIHGRVEGEVGKEGEPYLPVKGWINLGIPINFFLKIAPQLGIDLSDSAGAGSCAAGPGQCY
jgi:serine protease Do